MYGESLIRLEEGEMGHRIKGLNGFGQIRLRRYAGGSSGQET